jgi:hypothetical protein
MSLNIMTLSIKTLSIKTLSITTLSITLTSISKKAKKNTTFHPESLHFLREPTDGDVTPGGLIVFHCRASGGGQSPVIRWRKNGEPLDLQVQPRYRQLR